jgi:hypothetical protein
LFGAIIARPKIAQGTAKIENKGEQGEAGPLIIFTKEQDRLLHATT